MRDKVWWRYKKGHQYILMFEELFFRSIYFWLLNFNLFFNYFDKKSGFWIGFYWFFRYALANILLIIGAKKEIKVLLWVWILFTLGFIIWSFTLVTITCIISWKRIPNELELNFQVSVMFGYDTTPNFVAGVAVAQIANFAICAW